MTEAPELGEHLGHRLSGRVGAGRVGVEAALAHLPEDRLGHEGSGGVVRAQEEDVEGGSHVNLGLILGEESRQVATEVRSSATARLRQEAEERAQAGKTDRIDDVATLPGGLNETGLLQGSQMERQRRRQLPQRAGEFAGRHAGRSLARQKPHQVEAGLLRKGGKSGSYVR